MKKLIMIVFITGFVFAQDIVINEYLASNDACCTDEHGDYDDFIELYKSEMPLSVYRPSLGGCE